MTTPRAGNSSPAVAASGASTPTAALDTDASTISTQNVGHRASASARWAVLQSIGKHGIDLMVFLLLANLLLPQAFGLVAMASVVVVLASVLVELGLGDALVQRESLQEEHKSAAFWTSLATGFALAAAVMLAAPWAASAYGQPELAPLLQAMTPLFVINALTVVPQALYQREFAFRRLAIRALAAAALGGLAGVLMAMQGHGPWALVGQQLVSAVVGLVGLYWRTPWWPKRMVGNQASAELLRFSRHVMGARLLNVAASKADAFLVGLVLGPVALGLYSVACRLLLALEQLFCQGVDAVALSAFSRVHNDLPQLRQLFLSATRIAAVVAVPVFGGLVWLAPDVVALIVGKRWATSAALLQVLLGAGLLQALTHFNHAVFKACNRPELSMRMAMVSTGLNVVTLAIAVQFGVMAVAVSYLVRSVLIAPLGLVLACRLMALPVTQWLRQLLVPVLAFVGACCCALLVRWLMTGWMAPDELGLQLRLAASVVPGVAVYALVVRYFWVQSGVTKPGDSGATTTGFASARWAKL